MNASIFSRVVEFFEVTHGYGQDVSTKMTGNRMYVRTTPNYQRYRLNPGNTVSMAIYCVPDAWKIIIRLDLGLMPKILRTTLSPLECQFQERELCEYSYILTNYDTVSRNNHCLSAFSTKYLYFHCIDSPHRSHLIDCSFLKHL